MVFIDEGGAIDTQEDRRVKALFKLFERCFDEVFNAAGIDENEAIFHSYTGNVERADNEIFEFIFDRDAGCIALAGAEKLDEFGSRIVGDGGQC